MTRPKIESTITLGNLLQILCIVVAASGAIYVGNYRLGTSETAITDLRDDLSELRRDMRAMEMDVARQDERQSAILGTLGRIEASIDELRRQ